MFPRVGSHLGRSTLVSASSVGEDRVEQSEALAVLRATRFTLNGTLQLSPCKTLCEPFYLCFPNCKMGVITPIS